MRLISKEKDLIKSISVNAILKPVSMVISLAYTPLLLSYLGDERYGVWITIMAVMNWLTIFDFGIGGGYRNLLCIKIANKDREGIKKVTSTAYFSLSLIVSFLFVFGAIVVGFVDWRIVFNTEIHIQSAVFFVLVFICLNFIFGLTSSIFYASQNAQRVPFISVTMQLFNLTGIYMLNRFQLSVGESVTNVALLYVLAAIVVNVIALILLWHRNKEFIPKIGFFSSRYIKPIFNYGIRLFFLQMSAVVLFSTDNIIITQLYSPLDVTPYSITMTCFNVFNSFFTAILSPFWSRYTVEDNRGNYRWIKKSIKLQLGLWMLFVAVSFIIGLFLNDIYYIWLGRSLNVSNYLVFCMVVLMATEMFTGIFSNFLNGVSHINLQLVISVIAAILNIPLSIWFAKYVGLGVTGVCVGTIICQIIGCVCLPLDTLKYLRKKEGKQLE